MAPQLNRDREEAATTYLITWVCYGAWLPGQIGAVPRNQNRFGGRFPEPNSAKELQSRCQMAQEPYLLDSVRRQMVLKTMHEVCSCSCRGWTMLAAHVRTNHVHTIIRANCKPEQVLTAMKAYSSRALNKSELDGLDRRRWARHGSTRYLWTGDAVRAAIQYVVREQGGPMAVFEMPAAVVPRSRSGF
jgi:REP element-mobilizing transposase RayT